MALLKKKDSISKSYDVVVIGSGLGGLTAANKLAKDGFSVLLLEAHNKLGGLATWFKREGHIFDISLHGFPKGMIKTCKKYWNKEIASKIEKIKGVRFVNPMYDIETVFTKEDYIIKLEENFNVPKETSINFFNALEEMNFYDAPKMNNRELFNHYFPGREDVLRFLLEPIVYANGSNLEDPAITYAIVFSNFMKGGVYTFKGGTDVMIQMMKEELLKNNVDIKLHSKVEKILIENKKACGVIVAGQAVDAKAVLSNGNLHQTIFKMSGSEYFNEEFLNKAREVRLNTSSCQVYMGIKEGESIERMSDLIFYSEDESFSTDGLLSPEVKSQTFSLYYPDMRPHLNGRYAIVSSSNARYEDWSNLTPADYEERKNILIQKALDAVEKVIPGVGKKIDYIEAATPLTVEKFTHHKNGASFGTKFEGLEVSQDLDKQVEGLFHSGSVGIIMSGWLGAANYGVMKANDIYNYFQRN